MDMVAPRLEAVPDQDDEAMTELLNIDEAASCLVKDEQEKLAEEQAREKAIQRENLAVHEDYRELKRPLIGEAVDSSKKPKGDKIKVLANMELLEQLVVKKLFPERASVWKSRGSQTWHVQTRGWPKEVSRSVRKHGQHRAILMLMTESWYQWSVLNGKPFTAVLVEGLLELGEVFQEA